jgi:hypothetical protein
MISIQVLAEKCKFKIDYFDFFMNITLSGRKPQDLLFSILMLLNAYNDRQVLKSCYSRFLPDVIKIPSIFMSGRFYAGKNLRGLIFLV